MKVGDTLNDIPQDMEGRVGYPQYILHISESGGDNPQIKIIKKDGNIDEYGGSKDQTLNNMEGQKRTLNTNKNKSSRTKEEKGDGNMEGIEGLNTSNTYEDTSKNIGNITKTTTKLERPSIPQITEKTSLINKLLDSNVFGRDQQEIVENILKIIKNISTDSKPAHKEDIFDRASIKDITQEKCEEFLLMLKNKSVLYNPPNKPDYYWVV